MKLRARMLLAMLLLIAKSLAGQAPSAGPAASTVLEPMTIEQAVAEAVDKNLELIAARFDVPIAEARAVTARLRPNPVLSLEASHLLEPITTPFNLDHEAGPREFAIRADFVLERGGKRERRIEVAEASRDVARLQALNAVRTLTLDVETTFVDLLHAKHNNELAVETLRTFDDVVAVDTARVRAGDLAEVELFRAEVAQVQSQNAVQQSELQIQSARLRLQVLLGRRMSDPQPDALGDARRDAPAIDLAALRQNALIQRPDLLAQRRDQARSLAELKLQLAEHVVDYTVGAEYRRQEGPMSYGNLVGLFFSAPIPVFNRNQGEIARAGTELSQAETRTLALERVIDSEVETAYTQCSHALLTVQRIEDGMLNRAQELRRAAQYSYRRGEATFLEFLDAQRAYIDTMRAYSDARSDYARSLYSIDAATGASTFPATGPQGHKP